MPRAHRILLSAYPRWFRGEFGVAIGAAWVPAWRAATVSPVEALGAE